MLVYVQNKDGKPLMPTSRCGKVRRSLKAGKAVIVEQIPFTIRLCYDTTNYVQPITLGVDSGTKHIGLSATSNSKELYASEVELRSDIVDLISTRRESRRTRRGNKTRYRKARFKNSKKKSAVKPSTKEKINSHLRQIEFVHLGNYFISHGYPYNEMRVKPTRDKRRVEDALKNFRQGAAYFFEGFMYMAELDFIDEEEIAELAKCEHLCTIGKDDLQRVLESYKNTRMDLVRKLIQSDNE